MPKEGNDFLLQTQIRCWPLMVSDLLSLCIQAHTELGRTLAAKYFLPRQVITQPLVTWSIPSFTKEQAVGWLWKRQKHCKRTAAKGHCR